MAFGRQSFVLLDHGVLVGDNNNDFYQGCCLPLPNLDGAEGGEPSPTPNITVEVIANLSPEQEARFGASHLELK